MWIKLFDWLRLFEMTAVYPILIHEVFFDMYPFMITMMIVLGLFGNGLFILSNIVTYRGKEALYAKHVPNDLVSGVITNILSMTGDYDYSNYGVEDELGISIIIWFLFLF